MPFYLRKSISAGPFRFNLSKSGLGISTGVRGFRVSSGPRGNYIHMGRNGLYYRSTLSSKGRRRYSPTNPSFHSPSSFGKISYSQLTEIESEDVHNFQDASSAKLLTEINQKYKIPVYWIAVSLLCIIGLLISIIPIEGFFSALGMEFNLIHILAIYGLGFPLVIAFAIFLYYFNQSQKSIVLFYTMDNELENAYQSVHDTFQKLQACERKWHFKAKGNIYGAHQKKLSSGASALVNRGQINLSVSAPKWVKTNIAVPNIPVGKQVIYFFPDRILVQDSKNFGAIPYNDIKIDVQNSRFIEEAVLPSKAHVVDKTWKYPNKDGSPDRRFKNNYEIPIVLYSELHFTSSKGLNELIQLSQPNIGIEFAEAIYELSSVIENSLSQLDSKLKSSTDMEDEIFEFYSLLGYKILKTKKRSDFTTDMLILGKNKETWAARFENRGEITSDMIIDLQNFLGHVKPVRAALFTSGVFTPSAKEMVKDKNVALVDNNQFHEHLNRLRSKRETLQ